MSLTVGLRSVSVGSMDEFLTRFGGAVREYRLQRGMTQAELAERIGLARTSVTNLEKGDQNAPLTLLPTISRALGVDPIELVAHAVGKPAISSAGRLVSRVADANLREWAGRVIGDATPSDDPSRSPTDRELRRPRPGQAK